MVESRHRSTLGMRSPAMRLEPVSSVWYKLSRGFPGEGTRVVFKLQIPDLI